MTDDINDTQKHLERVNRSGFPLQIGLEYLLQKNPGRRHWHSLVSEYPWNYEESKTNGFIDLVIEDIHQVGIMVIECKRVRDTEWIFLIPPGEESRTHTNAWVSWKKSPEARRIFDWHDIQTEPNSPEAAFCIVAGQDAKSRPMLEKVASQLIDATEALAREEMQIYQLHGKEFWSARTYFPTIITTAELKVCKFDLAKIDIDNGDLLDAEFVTVPFLRFRKAFSIRASKLLSAGNIAHVSTASERTVYVVNSSSFESFLSQWDLPVNSLNSLR
ncbi:MAG: hypothetical protein M0Z32_07320 [Actinomycetota bacterium]|jgi:hypothetical protein|nr:hypothetical protein [Actinomycetota bacterium]MCL6092524.1 hypothetical protein [Actinomycetota bacterium]MDA8167535.1 hypothetical protein [Actinomycetota bacterium]